MTDTKAEPGHGGLEYTALNPAYSADPDAPLSELRNAFPVFRDNVFGSFFLTRHDDIRALLADRTLLKDPKKAEPDAFIMKFLQSEPEGTKYPAESGTILMMDDPGHARVRTPLTKAFYKRVAASRPIVEDVVERILSSLDGRNRFDAMEEFCIPVPIDVIARILGADQSMLESFRAWSVDSFEFFNFARTPEQTERMISANNNLYGYIDELMQRRRREPQDDLISDMMVAQAEGTPINDGEIRENCAGLLAAGNLTTTDLIGNGLWLLHTHPAEKRKLLADPTLIGNAIEEILRYEPPVEVTARIAARDMEIRGCPIKHSQVITPSLRGANRDPEAFEEPNRFDIARKHVPHVSFGGGSHICIGAPLARMEAQIAIPAFLRHFPDAVLEDKTPRWRTLPSFRGLSRIDMLVD